MLAMLAGAQASLKQSPNFDWIRPSGASALSWGILPSPLTSGFLRVVDSGETGRSRWPAPSQKIYKEKPKSGKASLWLEEIIHCQSKHGHLKVHNHNFVTKICKSKFPTNHLRSLFTRSISRSMSGVLSWFSLLAILIPENIKISLCHSVSLSLTLFYYL